MKSASRFTAVWSVVRLLVAALVGWAIVGQLIRSVTAATDNGRDVPTTVVNFFSFFTVLSNAATVVVLVWAAVLGLIAARTGRLREPRWMGIALATASTCMIVTGVVYNTLLRGVELPQGSTLWWSNEVLHVVGPLFMAIDLVVAPGRRRLRWVSVWAILGFPILWTIYTLVRGPLVTNPTTGEAWWYPYPFLDPHHTGWPGVIGYVVGIAVVIGAVASAVVWATRRFGHEPDTEPTDAHPTPA